MHSPLLAYLNIYPQTPQEPNTGVQKWKGVQNAPGAFRREKRDSGANTAVVAGVPKDPTAETSILAPFVRRRSGVRDGVG